MVDVLRVVDVNFIRIDSNDWAFRMRLQHENRQTGQIDRSDKIYLTVLLMHFSNFPCILAWPDNIVI